MHILAKKQGCLFTRQIIKTTHNAKGCNYQVTTYVGRYDLFLDGFRCERSITADNE